MLIKPNITFAGWMSIPPYGMVTTSTVVEGILRRLAERGCRDVTIGEGSVAESLGSSTWRGFRYTGIDRVARRYGARLIDLNEGPFESRDLGGVKVGISRAVAECDFLINVPVLKTHRQVKVSLALKNLKGCLAIPSRKRFHHKGLEHLICLLNDSVHSDLTVIDGIYMLEKGADTLMGTAHRKDLLIAGRDAFLCDCVGATIMGIEPSQVDYLREYAETHGKPLDPASISVVGEDLAPLQERLEWEFEAEDELHALGISGLSVPFPGHPLCSGCYASLICALGVLGKASPDQDFGDTRICWGRKRRDGGTGARLILYGDCGISSNRGEVAAARIPGCPPSMMSTLLTLMRTLLSKPRLLGTLLIGSPKLLALRTGLYSGNLEKWQRYRSPEFDRAHFRPSLWQRLRKTSGTRPK